MILIQITISIIIRWIKRNTRWKGMWAELVADEDTFQWQSSFNIYWSYKRISLSFLSTFSLFYSFVILFEKLHFIAFKSREKRALSRSCCPNKNKYFFILQFHLFYILYIPVVNFRKYLDLLSWFKIFSLFYRLFKRLHFSIKHGVGFATYLRAVIQKQDWRE